MTDCQQVQTLDECVRGPLLCHDLICKLLSTLAEQWGKETEPADKRPARVTNFNFVQPNHVNQNLTDVRHTRCCFPEL